MSAITVERSAGVPALQVVYEDRHPAEMPLPAPLREAYGGDLVLRAPLVYANFVASIDGVAAERGRPRSSKDISGGDARDRFVMGLLRATADVVLIGAGTFRSHRGGAWTPSHAFPAARAAYADLRSQWGLPRAPKLAVLSASGELPADAAVDGAMVFTTGVGFRRLPGSVLRGADVHVVADAPGDLDVGGVVAFLRATGAGRVLTEGGPTLVGSLVHAHALDELFLTVSPVLAGRDAASDRPGIVDGVALAPGRFDRAELVSLRRGGSLLFLRYAFAHDETGGTS